MTVPWLNVAKSLVGTREVPGPKSNPTILAWAKRLGSKVLGIAYLDDSVAWCGLFAAHCVSSSGLIPATIAVRASAWASWGSDLKVDRLAPGAVLVFARPGGGHVGFYVGEDAATYSVLGGNQSDAVSITRIEKSRCVARRWPLGVPVEDGPVWLAGKGAISTKES